MPHRRRWLALVTGLVVGSTLQAQPLATVRHGTTMRVETCTGATLTGRFEGVRADSLTLSSDSVVTSTVTFPPDRVTVTRAVATTCVRSYSVFERYGSSVGRGALVGGGIGLALVAVAYAGDRAYERRGGAATLPAVAFAVPVALALTGIGALIGTQSGPEEWSAPRAYGMHLRVLPQGGPGLLAIRF